MPSELVGNDVEAKIALNSLSKVGINIDSVFTENKPTNIMNILIPDTALEDNSILHCWYSPITNKCTMHFSENLPVHLPKELENEKIFILLDKFEAVNFEFVQNVKNKIVGLDVGHIRFIEHFSNQYLLNFFKTANLMQLNQNVCDLLFERFGIHNPTEFFDLLHLDLLVVTKGKKGASFIFSSNGKTICVDKTPEIIANVVDSSGAGDAFFATLIKQYAYYNKPIDFDFIDFTFNQANQSSRDVISQVGSRRV